ncbi:MAG TPA: MotA/TolQ/ExbB proton channel family protein, partial [Candidatus Bathyarchaeia archaeon]|nr:MotA/TolQ/ExbB proton channel family protein [Candidatus Bathyarchaeia archaeon]
AAAEAAEQVSANAIVSGVGEALIPAVAGLCIAILCTLGHSYCAAMIDRSALEMEEASAILVNELAQTGTM